MSNSHQQELDLEKVPEKARAWLARRRQPKQDETVSIEEEFVNFSDDDFSIRRDTIWAYHRLKSNDRSNPPSPGALGLLEWARENPRAFYEYYVPKVLLTRDEVGLASRFADNGRSILELIERVKNASRHALVPDTPDGTAGAFQEPQR